MNTTLHLWLSTVCRQRGWQYAKGAKGGNNDGTSLLRQDPQNECKEGKRCWFFHEIAKRPSE